MLQAIALRFYQSLNFDENHITVTYPRVKKKKLLEKGIHIFCGFAVVNVVVVQIIRLLRP
jgi:hypothetical protein